MWHRAATSLIVAIKPSQIDLYSNILIPSEKYTGRFEHSIHAKPHRYVVGSLRWDSTNRVCAIPCSCREWKTLN